MLMTIFRTSPTAQVVDLGGGQGILLAALCKRYGFRGRVVDRTGREQRSMGFFNDPMTSGCKMETSSSLGLQKTFQSMPRPEADLSCFHVHLHRSVFVSEIVGLLSAGLYPEVGAS